MAFERKPKTAGNSGNFSKGNASRGNFKAGGRQNGRNNDRNRRPRRDPPRQEVKVWVPKTVLGKEVLAGKFSSLQEVLVSGRKIMESEITDLVEPSLSTEFVDVGQAKGKFGGGKRKSSKATQKVTREGSKMSFAMTTLSGNREGIVGLGFGKSRETVPSREKAIKKAKENLIIIRRGCGDWGCFCGSAHSIPFAVTGKSGSCKVTFRPAPKGTGLVVESELKKMLQLAGVKDIWSKTFGSTKNKVNLMKAGFDALKQLEKVRLTPQMMEGRGIKEGNKDE